MWWWKRDLSSHRNLYRSIVTSLPQLLNDFWLGWSYCVCLCGEHAFIFPHLYLKTLLRHNQPISTSLERTKFVLALTRGDKPACLLLKAEDLKNTTEFLLTIRMISSGAVYLRCEKMRHENTLKHAQKNSKRREQIRKKH